MRGRHRNIVRVGAVRAAVALAGLSCGSSDENGPPPVEMEGGCEAGVCADAAVADMKTEGHPDVSVMDAQMEGRADVAVDAETEGRADVAMAEAETEAADVKTDAGDVQTDADAASAVDACADGGCPTCAIGTGLVGHWKFDDGAGTVAVDSSGGGNNGTLVNTPTWTGPAPTPYANTGALSFDGTSSFVTIGNPTALRITGPLSVACWFKSSSVLHEYRMLVSKWWSGEIDAAYALFFTSAGLQFSLFNGTMNLAAGANLALGDDVWHAAVGTWDGSTARVYVDGVLRNSVTNAAFGAIADITHPVNIGTDDRYAPGTGDRFFPGSIDDVRIYARALSAAEVGALFKGTCAPL